MKLLFQCFLNLI